MTVTVPKPAIRGEWLKARHAFYNASDSGVLYSVHPFRNLADVAVEKLSPEPPDNEPTEAMDRGVRLEPVLLEWFGDRHGCTVTTPEVLYVQDRLMATLDGEIAGAGDEWLEAKTTSYYWPEPPEHVYWQVVGQAAASGRRRCHVVWLDASMRIQSTVITPDVEHIADVLDRSRRFMEFIDLGMSPEGVALTAEHVARMYPEPVAGRFTDLDDDGLQAVVLWEQCRRARLDAEKAEREAKDAVANLLLDAEGARFDGRLVLSWKANKPSERVDWKALEAEHPDLVAGFRRQVRGPRVLRALKELEA